MIESFTRAGARIVRVCRRVLRGRGVSPARVHRLRCAIAASPQRAPCDADGAKVSIRMRLRIHTRIRERAKKIFILLIIINVCTECAVICALSVHYLCTTWL